MISTNERNEMPKNRPNNPPILEIKSINSVLEIN